MQPASCRASPWRAFCPAFSWVGAPLRAVQVAPGGGALGVLLATVALAVLGLQLDVPDPQAHRRQRDAKTSSDALHRHPQLAPEPSRLPLLRRFWPHQGSLLVTNIRSYKRTRESGQNHDCPPSAAPRLAYAAPWCNGQHVALSRRRRFGFDSRRGYSPCNPRST